MFQKLFAGKILEVSGRRRLARGTPVFKKCTVKPVYNGHPWDLKNVAVKQRVK
jgi:hypothetical protein